MEVLKPPRTDAAGDRSRRILAVVGDMQVGLWVLRNLSRRGLTVFCVCRSANGLPVHSRYAGGAFRLESRPSDSGFADELRGLATDLSVGSILPIAESYHRALIVARDRFEPDIHVFSPQAEAFRKATDKDYMHKLALNLGVPAARGMTAAELMAAPASARLRFPLVLRTRNQNAADEMTPWKAAYAADEGELERLNHEYENVIYALSHDLRSPLISIEGFLNKIEKHMGTPVEPVAHSLDRIHANVKIMNQLVNVLLDTSRIITGILDLHETDMGKLAREAAEQFAAQAAAQGARIEVTGDFEIETCDRVRVQQVYANLIGNALKHCRQTEGLVIELGADKRVYRVRDNGPGIPRDFQDVVFEPFTQGSKKLKESFGMGMNIVFRIMQKHGGEIWLETKESKGTTIFFAFKTPCNGQA